MQGELSTWRVEMNAVELLLFSGHVNIQSQGSKLIDADRPALNVTFRSMSQNKPFPDDGVKCILECISKQWPTETTDIL